MKYDKRNKLHLTDDQMTNSVALVWPTQNMGKDKLNLLEDLYVELLINLLQHQTRVFLVSNKTYLDRVDSIEKDFSNKYIKHLKFNSDDIWIRDYSPIQTFNPINKSTTFLSYTYNAYGEKYKYINDKNFSDFFLDSIDSSNNINICNNKIILEGGNIVNNADMCLINANCLKQHNKGQDFYQIKNNLVSFFKENIFQQLDFIDIPPITGDDTNGHIDNLIRFHDNSILIMSTNSQEHPDYYKLKKLKKQVYDICNINNINSLIEVDHKKILKNEKGKILPFSYLNYLQIANDIYMPLMGNETNDDKAYLREIFKNDDITFIHSYPLLNEYGGLHCCSYNWRCIE